MKYFLTSSGLKNADLANALSQLVSKPLSEISVLFVPTAANTEGSDKRWLIENLVDFTKYEVKSIDILDITSVPEDVWKNRFRQNDVICFGGGNEKYLAEVFDTLGMKAFLGTLGDTVYMGISAGSMVAGVFMPQDAYPVLFPEEEDFGKIIKDGLGLCNFCFIPHLNSNYFSRVRNDVLNEIQDTFTITTYATDDETALAVENENIGIVGTGEYWMIEK